MTRREESPEQAAERDAAHVARLGRCIAKLQEKGFFGSVTVKLQAGRVVDVRIEQVLKPDEVG